MSVEEKEQGEDIILVPVLFGEDMLIIPVPFGEYRLYRLDLVFERSKDKWDVDRKGGAAVFMYAHEANEAREA